MTQAGVMNTKVGYIVYLVSGQPIRLANFGDHQGMAIEFCDLINNDRVIDRTIERLMKTYSARKIFKGICYRTKHPTLIEER